MVEIKNEAKLDVFGMGKLLPDVILTGGVGSLIKRMLNKKTGLVLGVWLLYIALVLFHPPWMRTIIFIIAILPPLFTGWIFGLRAGLISAVLIVAVNSFLISLWSMSFSLAFLAGSALIVFSSVIVGRLSDLSDRLERKISELKETREREEFLHSLLRHDVKNKIQVIRGYLELVEDFDLPEEVEKYLSLSRKGGKEGVEIIEKVRTLREAQEEGIRKVKLDSAIFDAVGEVEGFAEERGVEIDVDCPEEGCEVLAGSLLDRGFSNIFENAVQHSGASKVSVRGEVSDDEVKCIVEDDGKGIPDEKKDKIFNKGFTTDEERGTGLGLFLVKTLLETYNGSVEVKDSELGGARFDIYFQKA